MESLFNFALSLLYLSLIHISGLHVDEKGASVGLQPYQTLAKQADFSVFWRFFGMFQGRICRGIGRLQSYRFAP